MNVLEYMKNNILYLDGGMGALLQDKGLKPGEQTEVWNITHPDTIIEVYKAYYSAGSNVINTNTFGANLLHYSEDKLVEVITAAVKLAADAKNYANRELGGEHYVFLDVGPLGKLLKPYGDLEFEDAVDIFKKTISIGVSAGVDGITIETMNDSYETKAALLAAKETCDLPVFVTNAYGEDGKLMTGADPLAMIAMLEGMGASAIGINCSYGPKTLMPVIEQYLKYSSLPVIFKPNAGLPESINGKTIYNVEPAEFADDLKLAIKKSVMIVGGCCGTTPEYISQVVDKTKNIKPLPVTDKNLSLISSYTHAVSFGDKPILIGERINPTGKKRFKAALKEHDINYILGEGLKEAAAYADVLDVNVGLPEIDETAMLKEVTCELQAIIDLPLQIDTSDEQALEAALRVYNGKAMINSVNGKADTMDKVFPLVKKYGGLVVALTLDEDGIPESATKRVEIAAKIIKRAADYGIDKKDLIFDPLAMAISAGADAANVTLDSVKMISEKLGAHTSLGVSNISFGLPKRPIINSAFFTLALERGLNAAIMNPMSADMMKSYYAYMALKGYDDNCLKYIEFAGGLNDEGATFNASALAATTGNSSENQSEMGACADELQYAIIKGLKDKAAAITKEALENGVEPLDIVNNRIIPALDTVGKGFEEKKIYLPQLLMSAEASKCAFEKVKEKVVIAGEKSGTKCKVILATVHGDIHDIGKNIVKLLLENYGFDVIDLGKDVPPSVIADAAVESHAKLVGLSALMTTTVPAMEETIKCIRESAPWAKVIVGGAVLTKEYADSIGADAYSKDAMETVRYAEENN